MSSVLFALAISLFLYTAVAFTVIAYILTNKDKLDATKLLTANTLFSLAFTLHVFSSVGPKALINLQANT